jgi:hypothetical protein
VPDVQRLLLAVQLAARGLDREEEVGQIAQEGVEVDQGGGAGLVENRESFESSEQLLELRVLVRVCPPAVPLSALDHTHQI